jgi:TPR repeat protein
MKLITLFLLVGILAVSGWAENYSPVLVKRAEAGDAESQYFLGTYYYYGGAVIQDYKEAVEWFTRSAKREMQMHNSFLVCATTEVKVFAEIVRKQ